MEIHNLERKKTSFGKLRRRTLLGGALLAVRMKARLPLQAMVAARLAGLSEPA